MHFSDFIIKFEDFLSGHIDRENFLALLESVENDLLDMEEISRKNKNQTLIDGIVKALEIIDDISIFLEEDLHVSEELSVCLKKLKELKTYFETDTPIKTFPDSSSGKLSQLKFSEPVFDFHPDMKFKMPLEDYISGADELSDIDLKTSPLYSLIEFARNYISSDGIMTGFQDILERTYREISELAKEDDNSDEVLIDLTEECLEKINEIEDSMEESDFMKELPVYIEELNILNEEFIDLRKQTLPDIPEMTEERLLEELLKRIGEENFITENYLVIVDKIRSFLDRNIDEDEVKISLHNMKEIITSARQDYEKSYISPGEWTLEVYLGDRMLSEGLTEWETSLNMLENCFPGRNKEEIDKVLHIAYEGNKKLVINQYLAEYIDEQILLHQTYSEKDF